jgi:hypothetical protein
MTSTAQSVAQIVGTSVVALATGIAIGRYMVRKGDDDEGEEGSEEEGSEEEDSDEDSEDEEGAPPRPDEPMKMVQCPPAARALMRVHNLIMSCLHETHCRFFACAWI